MKEAVYRRYYKKLKRLLRGRGVPAYDDFSPGDLLFRGQSKAQTDELLKGGATKSNGSGVLGDDKDKTYATTRMKMARIFAGRGDAMVATGNSQKPYRRESGEIISFIKQKDPGYSGRSSVPDSWSSSNWTDVDTSVPLSKWRSGAINDDTVALRNPITKDELRGILVKQKGAKHGYKPLPLGEAKERGFSAKLRLRELAAGSLRLVEMGYTKPGLRDRIKARIMASSKGGRPGQWSARKAQLVAQEYRAEGGGYKGGKTESQKSLRKWTREKWGTRSGKPSTQGSEATGERYLPESANKSLSPQEYGATTRAKREGTRRGEQFVKQPERIAEKTAKKRL
jgi:hypothetical protein